MQIMLMQNLPVAGAHGMFASRILDVIREGENGVGLGGYWVMSDAGDELLVLYRECEVL